MWEIYYPFWQLKLLFNIYRFYRHRTEKTQKKIKRVLFTIITIIVVWGSYSTYFFYHEDKAIAEILNLLNSTQCTLCMLVPFMKRKINGQLTKAHFNYRQFILAFKARGKVNNNLFDNIEAFSIHYWYKNIKEFGHWPISDLKEIFCVFHPLHHELICKNIEYKECIIKGINESTK